MTTDREEPSFAPLVSRLAELKEHLALSQRLFLRAEERALALQNERDAMEKVVEAARLWANSKPKSQSQGILAARLIMEITALDDQRKKTA